MSLSDTDGLRGLLLREITRRLTAWDVTTRSTVIFEPGTVISSCRIHRDREDGEPYVMEFRHSGRLYSCPLFRFQPRTQAVPFVGAERIPAREEAAV